MDPKTLSALLMVLASLIAVGGIRFFRPKRAKLWAAMTAGAFIAILNSLTEVAGAHLDIVHVGGLFPLSGTPLSGTFYWFFLALVFCLGYDSLRFMPHPRFARGIYLVGAVVGGVVFDFELGLMRLGEVGRWYHIVVIWSIFVPATIGVFTYAKGRINEIRVRANFSSPENFSEPSR